MLKDRHIIYVPSSSGALLIKDTMMKWASLSKESNMQKHWRNGRRFSLNSSTLPMHNLLKQDREREMCTRDRQDS